MGQSPGGSEPHNWNMLKAHSVLALKLNSGTQCHVTQLKYIINKTKVL